VVHPAPPGLLEYLNQGASSMGRKSKHMQKLYRKLLGKLPLVGSGNKCEDNIKIDLIS
jgi:hypothetical protein